MVDQKTFLICILYAREGCFLGLIRLYHEVHLLKHFAFHYVDTSELDI